jgi:hypothetical protein
MISTVLARAIATTSILLDADEHQFCSVQIQPTRRVSAPCPGGLHDYLDGHHARARHHIDEVQSSLEGDIDLNGFLELDKNVRNGFQGIRVDFQDQSRRVRRAVAADWSARSRTLAGV